MEDDINLASQFPVSNKRTGQDPDQLAQSHAANNPHLNFTDVELPNMNAGLQSSS